ncbi:hypothetical protein [Candidatus Thiodiazotropha sp. CDECU1]|uniref:hypothetical protein n=1 Tax=Candidatus Thiodiazotropha sp. CDECU1 TaxID=3065865 RepID=UPI002930C4E4|nr:hypothetical protein [Candidatus Thiodiazotropha sp. CDECU1]
MKDRSPDSDKTNRTLPVEDGALPPLTLDPEQYREHLEEFGLSREQENELLEALWNILYTFVEIGFGLDSVQLFVAPEDEKASRDSVKLVETKDVEMSDVNERERKSDE